ncbi:MAG: GNAT family N-acetyltransferase [Candidatus Binatia bacterium]|nr:GNAT family N-acetyltransferase [Candidatus Binatia bacterium]
MRPEWELHTPRLRLRALVDADAPDVFAYASDPCVTRFVEWSPHSSVEDSVAFIRQTQAVRRRGATFAVELVDGRRVIGTFELRIRSQIDGVGEIGYVLARPYWGQGFNLEAGVALLYYAFRVELLRRVDARCAPQNRRSFRTLEKLGMRRVPEVATVGRESAYARTHLMYSLTNLEWARHPLHSLWRDHIRCVR